MCILLNLLRGHIQKRDLKYPARLKKHKGQSCGTQYVHYETGRCIGTEQDIERHRVEDKEQKSITEIHDKFLNFMFLSMTSVITFK